ncbi:MAG: c-type cytochrome [Bacteroidales bacterium]|nr:c-type cytochrome [Bacteroidales bacterium]
MKTLLKLLKWTAIVLILIVAGFYSFVQLSWDKKYEAPYPNIKASIDSAVIARGEYLVYGPSHCATCHVPPDKMLAVDNGLKMPLIGGWEESFPGFGVFRAPNLTPCPETGIGQLTDAEITRSIRHMVKSDGTTLFPFMEYQGMSDEDLTAIISFLRSQEPVYNQVDRSDLGFVAKALSAFGVISPRGPKTAPPTNVPTDDVLEYGRYIAQDISNCKGCHIQMDDFGNQQGPDYAGGFLFPPNAFSEGYAYVSPNLTPHPTTGVMTNWTEEQFINRFKHGRIHKGSPMPWGSYSRMHDDDLKALYSYLQSLEPAEHKIEKTVYTPGEELPKP